METEATDTPLEKPLQVWTSMQISLAAYLSGPLGGCYLVSQNCKALGKESLSKKILLWGLLSTFILMGILLFIPATLIEKFPKMVIPIAYTAVISTYAEVYQKGPLRELMERGIKKRSFFKLVLTILGFLIIQAPLIFLFGFLGAYLT